MEAPQHEEVEAWKRNPWSKLPTWAKWTLGIIGAVILLAIGGAVGSSEADDLKVELDEAETALIDAESEREHAQEEAESVMDRRAEILGAARSESSQISGKLKNLRREVSATQSELAETESSLAGAEREEALSSLEDGVWQAETDFIPGTYRTAGGSNCYWAKLNSTDTFDIADNNNGVGQQVVTLDTPYFQTEGCGTWERIGE